MPPLDLGEPRLLNQESTFAGDRVLLPLLIVLITTAASGHPAPMFVPSDAPDSLNVERVGEIALISPPKAKTLTSSPTARTSISRAITR